MMDDDEFDDDDADDDDDDDNSDDREWTDKIRSKRSSEHGTLHIYHQQFWVKVMHVWSWHDATTVQVGSCHSNLRVSRRWLVIPSWS